MGAEGQRLLVPEGVGIAVIHRADATGEAGQPGQNLGADGGAGFWKGWGHGGVFQISG